jgi:hypothetical protein
VRGEFGVRVVLRPLLEAPEVEVLVLKRVRQLVRDDGLLAVDVYPVGEVELLRLRLVVARDLLGQKLYDEGAQLKVRGREAELLGRAPRRASLRASCSR